ncbi:MAG: hypothetical protein PHP50_05120 [Lachnospiraceae bacterium]|nr:hypothetical protein [Lachnospiraceae bacterium]
MKKRVNFYRVSAALIAGILFLLIIAVWPLGLIEHRITIAGQETPQEISEPVWDGKGLVQAFSPELDYLDTLSIYISSEGQRPFQLRVVDEALNCLYEEVIYTDENTMPGYCDVPVHLSLTAGEQYYFILGGTDEGVCVGLENTASSSMGELTGGSEDHTGYHIVSSYSYIAPLSAKRIIFYDGILITAGAVLLGFILFILKRTNLGEKTITVEQAVRKIGTPLVLLAGFSAMIAVGPLGLFGTDLVNILFLELGIVLLTGLLLFVMHHTCEETGVETNIRLLLQSLLFGGVFWSCIQYQNALSEYEHYVSVRSMLIYLGLALIVSFTKEELKRKIYLLYLPCMAVIGVLYYQRSIRNWGDACLAKQNAFLAAITGILLLNVLYLFQKRFVKKEKIMQPISLPYVLILGVYFGCTVLFANTRVWPIALVIAFVFTYIRVAVTADRRAWLTAVSNGVLISFGCVVIDALLHRPYHYFIYYRYPLVFHTVTMTAVYLSLVITVALIRFLTKYHRAYEYKFTDKIRLCWKESVVLGVALSYMLMTLSRNGFATVGLMAFIVITVYACIMMKNRGLRMACFWKQTGMVLLALCWCFPITFTAARTIPAMVNQPYIYWIEPFSESIVRGDPWDSPRYITIERFLQTFGIKMQGLPELVKQTKEEPKMLLASAEPERALHSFAKAIRENHLLYSSDAEEAVSVDQYTNGRLDIYKAYLGQLNLTGHDIMGATMPDGTLAIHAHNIYLQIAFDHGLITGVLFLLLCLMTLWRSLQFLKHYRTEMEAGLPLAISLAFMIAGLAEWISHLCNPMYCSFLLVLAPMLLKMEKES